MKGDQILSIYQHNAEFCLDGKLCNFTWIPIEDSVCFHFRDKFLKPSDNITIEDTSFMKYKDKLMEAVEKVLSETGFRP